MPPIMTPSTCVDNKRAMFNEWGAEVSRWDPKRYMPGWKERLIATISLTPLRGPRPLETLQLRRNVGGLATQRYVDIGELT